MMQKRTFAARWTSIKDQFDSKINDANAYLDQKAAALFVESKWTQQEIADEVGMSQTWVSNRLRFGRFLDFITRVINLETAPRNLHEKKFREYWLQTEGPKEEPRFRKVFCAMEDDLIICKEPVNAGQIIADDFADGKWHHWSDLVDGIGLDPDDTKALSHAIGRIRKDHARGLMVEEKPSTGGKKKYRFKKVSKKAAKASAADVIEALRPFVTLAMKNINVKIAQDAIGLTKCDIQNIKKVLDEYSK